MGFVQSEKVIMIVRIPRQQGCLRVQDGIREMELDLDNHPLKRSGVRVTLGEWYRVLMESVDVRLVILASRCDTVHALFTLLVHTCGDRFRHCLCRRIALL